MVINLLYFLIFILIPFCWWTFSYLRKLKIYRQVYELENSFEAELDFGPLSKNILQRIMKEIKASAGIIYWFDEAQSKYKLKTFQGIPANKLDQISRDLTTKSGVIDRVSSSQKELIIKNVVSNPLTGTDGHKELNGLFSSLLALPLNTSKKTVGIILLFKSRSKFSKWERLLLNLFAERAAIQLDHSRLYQLATDTALENAKLYINISNLYQKAILDELTGLYNRHFLLLKLKDEIKKAYRYQHPLSIIFTDIDLFKEVNDRFGHSAGDQVLIEFADLLKNSIRESDLVCRFGGEEFVIILPQTDSSRAKLLAEKLRQRIAVSLFCTNNIGIRFTASFGISSFWDLDSAIPQNFEDEIMNSIIENFLALADGALYRAKKGGRNKVVVFKNQMKTVK